LPFGLLFGPALVPGDDERLDDMVICDELWLCHVMPANASALVLVASPVAPRFALFPYSVRAEYDLRGRTSLLSRGWCGTKLKTTNPVLRYTHTDFDKPCSHPSKFAIPSERKTVPARP